MKRNDNMTEVAKKALEDSKRKLEERGILQVVQNFLETEEVTQRINIEYSTCIMEIIPLMCVQKGERMIEENLYEKIPKEESFINDVQANAIRRLSAAIDRLELYGNKLFAEEFVEKVKKSPAVMMTDLNEIITVQISMLKQYAISL